MLLSRYVHVVWTENDATKRHKQRSNMPGTAELVMLVEFSRSVHSKYIEQQIVVYFFSNNRHIYKLLGFWSNQINNIQQSYNP